MNIFTASCWHVFEFFNVSYLLLIDDFCAFNMCVKLLWNTELVEILNFHELNRLYARSLSNSSLLYSTFIIMSWYKWSLKSIGRQGILAIVKNEPDHFQPLPKSRSTCSIYANICVFLYICEVYLSLFHLKHKSTDPRNRMLEEIKMSNVVIIVD